MSEKKRFLKRNLFDILALNCLKLFPYFLKLEINCGEVGRLSNGIVEKSNEGTALGAVVQFKCFSNTTLMGHNFTICQEDGKWSNPLPKCLGK